MKTLNFGLKQKQDPAELPRSAVPVAMPERKSKVAAAPRLRPVGNGEWILADGWELAEADKITASGQPLFSPDLDTADWYNATVPGTVLSTLVDQGIYPDPYFGLNNLAIPDSLCRSDWWYRTTFRIPEGQENKTTICLLLNGINYRAAIWLNGKRVGDMSGAFRRGEFNITDVVDPRGDNILAVHIQPPPNPGIPHETSARSGGAGPNGGRLCLDGPTFISSEGWDWVPGIRDRNIGIWQDVRLRITGDVKIIDPRVITDLPLPDASVAELTVKTELFNASSTATTVVLTGTIEDVVFSGTVELPPGQRTKVAFTAEDFSQLSFSEPRLWWPNGHGAPELYRLDLSVSDTNGTPLDSRSIRFGIRKLTYELTVDAPEHEAWRVEFDPTTALKDGRPLFDNVTRREVSNNLVIPCLRSGVDPALLTGLPDTGAAPYLVIKVNGERVFCKGGNWGMDDAMKRVSREHLEPYFRLHRDANFNMVRNWTGESTEEVFYELCDEYGLLVWNDFWMSTEGFNVEATDHQLFLDNARDVIRRFRHHPSIALWCPRNEGYAPKGLEDELAHMVATEDGSRLYQPNSQCMNLRGSGPWNYVEQPADYFTGVAAGFSTEVGTPSVPTAASMRKMMPSEDLWPISDAWFYHDLYDWHQTYPVCVQKLYGKAENLDDFCKKAQMANYDSHRAIFEAWNSKLWNDTTGLLLWMTHPAWPSTVWQVYSWDCETFGSYFGSRKACEPVHVQMNLHDNHVVVVNTSRKSYEKAHVSLAYCDLAGVPFYDKGQDINIAANQLTDCFVPETPHSLPDVYLARLTLTDQDGRTLSTNDYWKRSPEGTHFDALNQLAPVRLTAEFSSDGGFDGSGRLRLKLTNPSRTPAVAVKLNLRDAATGDILLPAYFSDGYFNLLPSERKEIGLEYPGHLSGPARITVEGYNVVSEAILPIA